jgi:hypothetical protein
MIAFIEECRDEFGVGSICSVLPIAPSSYDAQLAIRCDPSKASKRAQQDARDSREIRLSIPDQDGSVNRWNNPQGLVSGGRLGACAPK